MKLFITASLIAFSFSLSALNRPLFTKSELEVLNFYKSDKYLNLQKARNIKNFADLRVKYIIKSMNESDKRFLVSKFKNDFWKNFDLQTDKEINKKVILDLILKDLYKK
jgi:predicted GNAT family acetyltransferase